MHTANRCYWHQWTTLYFLVSQSQTCTFVCVLEKTVAYVQIPLDGPGHALSLVGSGRVVAKFHYTDPTRPDPRTMGQQSIALIVRLCRALLTALCDDQRGVASEIFKV